ncbi:MAG: hypothetical protein LUE86_10165 [Clostridiales bacterium]|nr:hypothetical protein [Clostridiales bacterium]
MGNHSSEMLYGKGLLYEYTLILTGELSSFSSIYFGSKSVDNVGFAKFVFRKAIEVFLHWTPEEAQVKLNEDIITRMKLDRVMNYLNLPPDIERNHNWGQVVAYLYPEILHLHETEMVVDTYEAVLAGQENGGLYKFPKHYFDGQTGRKRGHICLRYLIEHNCVFENIRDMYKFFASEAGVRLINEKGLKLVLRDVFHSPVLYLHESLPEDMKDEFWYHYYEFHYQYKKEKLFREKNLKKLEEKTKL